MPNLCPGCSDGRALQQGSVSYKFSEAVENDEAARTPLVSTRSSSVAQKARLARESPKLRGKSSTKKGGCKGKNHKILGFSATVTLPVVGHPSASPGYGVEGCGLEFPMSTTIFQEPSACFFQMLTYFPWRSTAPPWGLGPRATYVP